MLAVPSRLIPPHDDQSHAITVGCDAAWKDDIQTQGEGVACLCPKLERTGRTPL